jgi:hypothetical protein
MILIVVAALSATVAIESSFRHNEHRRAAGVRGAAMIAIGCFSLQKLRIFSEHNFR